MLTDSEILYIKRFLTMLMIREPSLIDKTVEKTIIAKELGVKPTPSKFVKMLEHTNLVDKFFENHYPVIIFNKTSKPYISSIRGFCVWQSTFNKLNWWFPVTPTLAIHFVDSGVFSKLYKQSSGAEMPDEKSVEFYNEKIIESAIEQGNKYVFSNTRDELERLLNKYKK